MRAVPCAFARADMAPGKPSCTTSSSGDWKLPFSTTHACQAIPFHVPQSVKRRVDRQLRAFAAAEAALQGALAAVADAGGDGQTPLISPAAAEASRRLAALRHPAVALAVLPQQQAQSPVALRNLFKPEYNVVECLCLPHSVDVVTFLLCSPPQSIATGMLLWRPACVQWR